MKASYLKFKSNGNPRKKIPVQLDGTYWLIAWSMMGLAFLTASGAILIGAKRLDQESEKRDSNNH